MEWCLICVIKEKKTTAKIEHFFNAYWKKQRKNKFSFSLVFSSISHGTLQCNDCTFLVKARCIKKWKYTSWISEKCTWDVYKSKWFLLMGWQWKCTEKRTNLKYSSAISGCIEPDYWFDNGKCIFTNDYIHAGVRANDK